MTIKIQHKRSAVKGKAPQPADLEYGEIAVNYEASDPSLYVKDTNNAVRQLGASPWVKNGTTLSPRNAGDKALSSDVSFTQAGTGAKARTVDDKLKDVVSVKDFGAKGDGVADDTAAIQAAIDFVSTVGGELLLPPGTYKITKTLTKTFSDGLTVAVRGYGAKIDATSITTGNAIELGGSRVTSNPLASNASKGSVSFVVASASGITPGRVLLITSTDLWNPTRPYYYKGELALTELVTGATVTGSTALYDDYTAATTTVHLLNMPRITVEGLEIACDADVTSLQILYGRNVVVRNCNIHGSRYAGVYVGYCLGATVDSNFIYDVWNGIVTGNSYGISLGSGQKMKVVNNTILGARHAITGGGNEPLREVIYANNACSDSTRETQVGCIDLHGNIEDAIIQGNTTASINIAAKNCVILGNILTNTATNVPGILIFQETNSDYYTISGNKISCAGAASYGIWVGPAVAGVNIKKLTLASNVIDSVFSSVYISPRAASVTGCSIDNIILRDNYLRNTGAQPAFTFASNGAATYSAANLLSSGNIYSSINYDAFHAKDNPIVITNSVGDVFKANRANGSLAWFCGTDVRLTAPLFYGNTGGAGDSRQISYANTGRVDVFNPVFANLTFKAAYDHVTEYFESGWYSATPGIDGTSARIVNSYAAGSAVAYGTAAPTTKTWSVGDRVYNKAPAVGQPKSWVCTVAGTPGTWVSEGNL